MTVRVWDLDDMDPADLAEVPSPIEEHIAGVRKAWNQRRDDG